MEGPVYFTTYSLNISQSINKVLAPSVELLSKMIYAQWPKSQPEADPTCYQSTSICSVSNCDRDFIRMARMNLQRNRVTLLCGFMWAVTMITLASQQMAQEDCHIPLVAHNYIQGSAGSALCLSLAVVAAWRVGVYRQLPRQATSHAGLLMAATVAGVDQAHGRGKMGIVR